MSENKKMKKCKTCGAEMAKSAKKCPSCGAKNNVKSLVKLMIFLLIIVTVCGVIIGKSIVADKKVTIISVKDTVHTEKEIIEIYNEYYINDKVDEFREEYLPASIEVEGEITQISSNTVNKTTITIEGKYFYGIDTTFKEFDSNLEVGDKVKAVGILDWTNTVNSGIVIKDFRTRNIQGTSDGINKIDK